ncbi:MAG: glycoside hydrolase family 68 protein [Gordonia sp. (in: high G+C Gram-positive bacteria)]
MPCTTAVWTREHVESMELRSELMAPPIPRDFPVMSDDVWLWDTWPLTDLSMRPVSVCGRHVIIGLVAPRAIAFDDRHAIARIGWFTSCDGHQWNYRGHLIPDGVALGTRQWSGSAVLIGDQVHLFYTACGSGDDPGADWERTDYVQRVAHATATVEATPDGFDLGARRFLDSVIVAEGDGRLYQTHHEAEGSEILYGFRDPFVFGDDGDVLMLFSGNQPGPGCFTANVGLARALDSALDRWELLPPLLHAVGVNQQLERPHLVRDNGLYYLFFLSHRETYAPGLSGPDGLYAFVSERLRGGYRPVNGSGLVMANPLDRPPERYADYVMPNWLVEGFIDMVGDRRGGTLAPTLHLTADGDGRGGSLPRLRRGPCHDRRGHPGTALTVRRPRGPASTRPDCPRARGASRPYPTRWGTGGPAPK